MKFWQLVATAALGACVSQACGSEKAAILALDPSDDLSVVTAALAEAEGRANLIYGSPDPRVQPVLSVLPPRPTSYETRSPVLPSTYDILITDGHCVLRRRADDHEVILPPDIPCTAYQP